MVVCGAKNSRGEYMSKKSETVYLPICGILKLSVQLNQKIVKLPIKIVKQSISVYLKVSTRH